MAESAVSGEPEEPRGEFVDEFDTPHPRHAGYDHVCRTAGVAVDVGSDDSRSGTDPCYDNSRVNAGADSKRGD